MKTDPIYLTNPYQKSMNATILEIELEKRGCYRVMLDRTVFYPMGGGQPTDQGQLEWHSQNNTINEVSVYQVLVKEAEIWHYIQVKNNVPNIGQNLEGILDWERRYLNMRLHTGGHLIDFALCRLGLVPNPLKPLKADHSKKPFILYQGQRSADLTISNLNAAVNQLIEEQRNLTWEFTSLEELQKDAIYLQLGLPTHKPLRKLTLEGVGSVADGGTLVANTRELTNVTILGIDYDHDKQQVKITYKL